MKCPYCNARLSEIRVEQNDGCCTECGAAIMYAEEEDDDIADMEDIDDEESPNQVDERWLGPTDVDEEMEDEKDNYDNSPYTKDEFDEFLEEEEKREREEIYEKKRKRDETKNLCTRPPAHRRKKK